MLSSPKCLLMVCVDLTFMFNQEVCKDTIRVKGRFEEGHSGITIRLIGSRVFPVFGLFVCSSGRRHSAWRRLLLTWR